MKYPVPNNNNIIVDLMNVTNVIRHSKFKGNREQFDPDLLFYYVLESIVYYAEKFRADGILIAVDSRNGWRKKIFPEYKAHRDANRDPYYEDIVETVVELHNFFENYTDVTSVKVDTAEADDVIAVASKTNACHDIIISSDSDFVQLISDTTDVFDLRNKRIREVADPDYELFYKIIRGDKASDNIPSAFPRVKTTRIEKAWTDPEELSMMMETVLPTGEKVYDLFMRNSTLINLNYIPESLVEDIKEDINECINKLSYDFIKTRRYFGIREMSDVSKNINMDVFKKSYKFLRA